MKRGFVVVLCFILILAGLPVYAAGGGSSSGIMLTVVFQNNNIPAEVKSEIVNSGGEIISELPEIGALQFYGNSSFISTLKRFSSVRAISPSLTVSLPETSVVPLENSAVDTTNADLYNLYQWDIKRVTNNGASYEIETGSHDVVVGIIDTGVSRNHPALKGNLLGGRNYVPAGGIYGTDTTETGDPSDYEDRNGHGSHVAGTIAGNGRILGVAPNVGFKAYRVFGATGGAYTATIASAMIGAANDGVDVISMSLGGFDWMGQYWWTDPDTGVTYQLGNDVADYLVYQRAAKYAVDRGITVVAAAGNDALNATNKKKVTDYMNVEYGPYGYKIVGASFEAPGNVPGVITVSATGPDDSLSSYSNYGAGFIDLTAPGGDFRRYPVGDWYVDMNLSAYKGTGYVWMAGTSMATPKVSAVAALIIAKEGKIGPQKVAEKLYKTAEDIGKNGTDAYFGYGMVNAFTALK